MSSNLLNLFFEISYWDELKYEIPQCVSELYQDMWEFMDLGEEALLLTRSYNR